MSADDHLNAVQFPYRAHDQIMHPMGESMGDWVVHGANDDPSCPHCPPRKLYHATDAEIPVGGMVQTANSLGIPSAHPTENKKHAAIERDHVFGVMNHPALVKDYGQNIYQVEPTGPLTPDPQDRRRGAVMSRHPMRVIGRVDQ